ncbi:MULTISPECIES: hypothetical protein [Empedobacter]|uniref:Uncharacterized protein n=1 Tax=Empedobacter falsenii TaxID=343874 RepID=A0A376G665_9FLAO|nr:MULTISPECIES: hypothetical protein [Empedobacter]HBX63656.1 hypothetical protein [Flavobacteriaceae bacterium]MBW1618701.1 hypothetical protein [Empedobacter falsenii]MBY0066522.1 hypothetical protein [Empedobacter falsenii]MDM1139800.1 hypothetical protein [Empedobacter sp. R132-2]STD56185.1 Uncharacterised protein [Empedobacter falsenii]
MTIINRFTAPTPKLFQQLRNIGLTLAAIGGVLIAAPIALPATLVTIGGYLTVAGGVISAVSQLTVNDKNQSNDDE